MYYIYRNREKREERGRGERGDGEEQNPGYGI